MAPGWDGLVPKDGIENQDREIMEAVVRTLQAARREGSIHDRFENNGSHPVKRSDGLSNYICCNVRMRFSQDIPLSATIC
jgi:hypothetical protein